MGTYEFANYRTHIAQYRTCPHVPHGRHPSEHLSRVTHSSIIKPRLVQGTYGPVMVPALACYGLFTFYKQYLVMRALKLYRTCTARPNSYGAILTSPCPRAGLYELYWKQSGNIPHGTGCDPNCYVLLTLCLLHFFILKATLCAVCITHFIDLFNTSQGYSHGSRIGCDCYALVFGNSTLTHG